MKTKSIYEAPFIHIIRMDTQDNIAQFIVSSTPIGENSGEAKGGFYDEEEEEEEEYDNTWGW